MDGLGRVQEKRRRAGAGQGGGNLAADMPRFAHARDDHAAADADEAAASGSECGIQPFHQCGHGRSFGGEGGTAGGQNAGIVEGRSHGSIIARPGVGSPSVAHRDAHRRTFP